jgi:hypothetical protein
MEIRKQHLVNEERAYLAIYIEKASSRRGSIIDGTISVEMKLAEALSCFFNHDEIKQKFILSSVFTNAGLSFASKTHILQEVLTKFFPDLLLLYPSIITEINALIHLRSIIDHSMTDTSHDFIKNRYNDRVQLIYFMEGERKLMTVSDDDFNARMNTISYVLDGLDHIRLGMRVN